MKKLFLLILLVPQLYAMEHAVAVSLWWKKLVAVGMIGLLVGDSMPASATGNSELVALDNVELGVSYQTYGNADCLADVHNQARQLIKERLLRDRCSHTCISYSSGDDAQEEQCDVCGKLYGVKKHTHSSVSNYLQELHELSACGD